jgi:alpha-L-rhamnosidase
LLLFSACLFAQIEISDVRIENLKQPLGLDVPIPRFGWKLSSISRNLMQEAYEIQVATSHESLIAEKNLVWSSGKTLSDASVWVPYNGPGLLPGKKYWWRVRVWDNHGNVSAWSQPNFWRIGLLTPADWKAQWISNAEPEDSTQPCLIFRKEVNIKKKVSSATAYITCHGMYEAFINGKRVGEDYLTPGWTAYQKRLQYQAYDVTHMLETNQNALAVTVGNGWWRGFIGFGKNHNFYGKDLALLLQLDIEYTDGSRETIGTDGTWKYSDKGPIRNAEIYHGETYDARMEPMGWKSADYSDGQWKFVAVKDIAKDNLIGTYNEPIRKHESFSPVKIFRTPKGELVADFGQNLVGWVALKAEGKAGDTIRLKFAEVLDKDGNFYTANLRAARCTDIWVLKGSGIESFEPHFTFHGFRYAKIEGYPGELAPASINAIALYSAMEPAGQFVCSDSLVNQLQHNIQWGQRGNFLDVPTDCPQRDERLGWTGDAQAFSRTATFNFDVHNFFSKWLKDLAADQQPNGMVPWVVPNVLWPKAGGAAGWADAATIIPWNMWLVYADPRILEAQYTSMKSWVEYMRAQSKDDLWNTGDHFGDWLFYSAPDDNDGKSAVTDKYLIAQCFYAHSTQLLINAAQVLDKQADVADYTALLAKIKSAYLNEYVTPNGRTISPTQTAYVLALQFDMLPEHQREKAAFNLAENIKKYKNHLTTGFLGTPYLCHVLTKYGYTDLAFTLLNQKTYPSWLYPVTKGATTIWERWDGIRPDGSFQATTMNSFNHYAYGAIGDWMYRIMAGLDADPAVPGYKSLRIQPHVGGGFSHASAEYKSLYGLSASSWKLEGKKLLVELKIPGNTTATVILPFVEGVNITESGTPIETHADLKIINKTAGLIEIKIGSGEYKFETSIQ